MENMSFDGFIRSDIWFSDGNAILSAEHTLFKVHRGQLARHSDVFRDMFLVPQPANEPMFEGCIVVRLHDSPSDVQHLLMALYDGMYCLKPCAANFSATAAVLRLSIKYLFEHLRQHCIARLELDWPTTLAGWDRREAAATDANGHYNPRDCLPHPILVINLARDLGLNLLLAPALYDLSRYGPSKIAAAFNHDVLAQGSVNVTERDVHQILSPVSLQQDLHATLIGREIGQRYLASFIESQLASRSPGPECMNKSIDSGRHCRESFYFIQLNVLRSVGGIAAGRDGDLLYTLNQSLEMLSRTDFSDGERQCGLRICNTCRVAFVTEVEKVREEVWAQIPHWFGALV